MLLFIEYFQSIIASKISQIREIYKNQVSDHHSFHLQLKKLSISDNNLAKNSDLKQNLGMSSGWQMLQIMIK